MYAFFEAMFVNIIATRVTLRDVTGTKPADQPIYMAWLMVGGF